MDWTCLSYLRHENSRPGHAKSQKVHGRTQCNHNMSNPSRKQTTQAYSCKCHNATINDLSRHLHAEVVYFKIKELYKAKQEIQKSTYFAFHSHKTQKVMSTFFIPCFVGVFGCVAVAAPPQL
jgi:hypothetical protein